MPRLIFFNKLNPYVLIFCLSAFPAFPQISEYEDCSEIDKEDSSARIPLTAKEKVERLENQYYPKISAVTKCNPVTPSINNGQGGGANAGAAGSNTGGGSGNHGQGGESISNNQLDPGETSIGIANRMFPEAAQEYQQQGQLDPDTEFGTTGRKHKELESADNTAALKAQLQIELQKEDDPVIRENLKKRIEALK